MDPVSNSGDLQNIARRNERQFGGVHVLGYNDKTEIVNLFVLETK